MSKLDEVMKLRPGTLAKRDDLHSMTGFDYLSLDQWDAMLDEILWRHILNKNPLPPAARVLDVGCGSGAVTDYLLRKTNHNLEAYGFDLTPALLEIAQLRVKNAQFWQGDMTTESAYAHLEPKSFHLIVCCGVLEFLNSHDDIRKALEFIYNLLRPGGIAFLGYILNEDSKPEIEKSRQESKRGEAFRHLLGNLPRYLYSGYNLFRDFEAQSGCSMWIEPISEQLENHPMFSPVPLSFRSRYCVYFMKDK